MVGLMKNVTVALFGRLRGVIPIEHGVRQAPTLATGAHSEETITMYITIPYRRLTHAPDS